MKNTLKCASLVALLSISGLISACGKKGEETHTHKFGDWTIVTPATHTSDGKETRSCECGETEERDVPKTTEHEFGEWTQVTAPTHTSIGKEIRTCECGETEERDIEKLSEHTYQETRTEAGYLTDGKIVYTCACGDTYSEKIPSVKSTIKDMKITDFDAENELADVTVTFKDNTTVVFENLLVTIDKENDLIKIKTDLNNTKIVKETFNRGLAIAKDLINDIIQNCTYEYHYHQFSNGVCNCGNATFYMSIEDVFNITDVGVVISGTVKGASIQLGDKVKVYNGTEFVEYTISRIEYARKILEKAEVGMKIGLSFEESPSKDEFTNGMMIVTNEGNWTPKTTISGIISLPTRRTPITDGFRPLFYYEGQLIAGKVSLPDDVETVFPGDKQIVTVEFMHPFIALDKAQYAIRESSSGTTIGYFVTNYAEDELGTPVTAVRVSYPSTPGAASSSKEITPTHYLDNEGNAYVDLALTKPFTEEIEYYSFFSGVTGASTIPGRGTIVTTTNKPYDDIEISWVVNKDIIALINKEATLLVYDAETGAINKEITIITGARFNEDGTYEFLLRGMPLDTAQKAIALCIIK